MNGFRHNISHHNISQPTQCDQSNTVQYDSRCRFQLSSCFLVTALLSLVTIVGFPALVLFFSHHSSNDVHPYRFSFAGRGLGLVDTTETTANGGYVPSFTPPSSHHSNPPPRPKPHPRPRPKPQPTHAPPKPQPKPQPRPTPVPPKPQPPNPQPKPQPAPPRTATPAPGPSSGSGNQRGNNPGHVHGQGDHPTDPGDGRGPGAGKNAGDFHHFDPCSFSPTELQGYGLPYLSEHFRIPASWPDYPTQVDFVVSGCGYQSSDHHWMLGIQKLTTILGRPDSFYQMNYWENATTIYIKNHQGHQQTFGLSDGDRGYGRNHPNGSKMCLIDVGPGVEYFLTDDTGQTSYHVLCDTLRKFVSHLYT